MVEQVENGSRDLCDKPQEFFVDSLWPWVHSSLLSLVYFPVSGQSSTRGLLTLVPTTLTPYLFVSVPKYNTRLLISRPRTTKLHGDRSPVNLSDLRKMETKEQISRRGVVGSNGRWPTTENIVINYTDSKSTKRRVKYVKIVSTDRLKSKGLMKE